MERQWSLLVVIVKEQSALFCVDFIHLLHKASVEVFVTHRRFAVKGEEQTVFKRRSNLHKKVVNVFVDRHHTLPTAFCTLTAFTVRP